MATAHSGMLTWFSVFLPISKKQIAELNPKPLERIKLLKIRFKLSANSWSPKALKNRWKKSVSHFIIEIYGMGTAKLYLLKAGTSAFRQTHFMWFYQHSCIRGFPKFKMQGKANTRKKPYSVLSNLTLHAIIHRWKSHTRKKLPTFKMFFWAKR